MKGKIIQRRSYIFSLQEERVQLLQLLKDKKMMKESLAKELEQYKACDPETLKEMRRFFPLLVIFNCKLYARVHTCTCIYAHPHMHTHTYTHLHTYTIHITGQQTQVAVAAANRWTENVFVTKSWCKDRFSVDGDTLDKQFGIPEDFDYL